MKVNEKIRLLREEKQWSQEDMAEKLNMSVTGYAKIERGESNSTMPRLEQISEVFGLDLCDFFMYGEEGKFVFQHSGNNLQYSCISLGSGNAELENQIQHLQLLVAHKEQIITMQQEKLKLLEDMVAILKQQSANAAT